MTRFILSAPAITLASLLLLLGTPRPSSASEGLTIQGDILAGKVCIKGVGDISLEGSFDQLEVGIDGDTSLSGDYGTIAAYAPSTNLDCKPKEYTIVNEGGDGEGVATLCNSTDRMLALTMEVFGKQMNINARECLVWYVSFVIPMSTPRSPASPSDTRTFSFDIWSEATLVELPGGQISVQNALPVSVRGPVRDIARQWAQ